MDRGERKQNRRMKGALFCVFLIIFVVIVAFTIAKVFFDLGNPKPNERDILFKVFVAEVGVAVLALFKTLFNLKRQPKEKTPIPKVCGKYKYELACGDNKTLFKGECRIKQDGRLLDIHGERQKARFGRKKEQVSIHWYSQWAELCRDNKVRLDYFITQNGGVRGYAVLDLGRVNPKQLTGEFHFLHEPYVYGTIKLRRV